MVIIYECILILHDYTFFTARGVWSTTMSEYIGNYAMMYAINREPAAIHRNASGVVPFYDKDAELLSIYATPAELVSSPPPWLFKYLDAPEYVHSAGIYPKVSLTFNSIFTITNRTEGVDVNIPQFGKKEKFLPMTCFRFFAIGGEPLGIVRVGKKSASARIYSKLVKSNVTQKSGDFEPNHPLSLKDHENIGIKSGKIVNQFPPLLIHSVINGEYYEFKSESGKETIRVAVPSKNRFKNVKQ
jgi:CRISPR type I-D-associated protein Csc1